MDYFVCGHLPSARDYSEPGWRVVHLGGWEKNPAYAVLDGAGTISLEKL